jgi:NAD(P)-dependent dehydrogenase (short-subunit alcohol dehydrogenase family)
MLAGRHVIITGATAGIGKELVKKFAKTGAKVTVGHNLQQGPTFDLAKDFIQQVAAESNNNSLKLKYIDVSDFDSVRHFASDVEDCHILINNAGIMSSEQKKQDGMELTMRTNFLGPFLLTNLLVPAMMYSSEKDSTVCRVLNLSSTSEEKAEAFPGRDPLGQSAIRGDLPDSVTDQRNKSSKVHFFGMLNSLDWIRDGPVPYFMLTAYANASLCTILATTVELSRRLKFLQARQHKEGRGSGIPFSITVNSVCPGYVNTDLWKDSSLLWTPFRYMIFKSPEKGAEIVYNYATSKNYDDVSGEFFSSMEGNVSSDMSKSEELSKLVWEKSCKLVNIKNDIYLE